MTNQKGAPEALFYADALDRCAEVDFDHIFVPSAAVIRRLHAENQRLATLVDAQQPAPSAAATVGEAPLPLLVRDIAADLGTTPIQVCTALATLGFGGHSVNMAVTPRMAQSLRAHFASPTPQADSQPAPDDFQPCPSCFGTGVEGDADDYGRTIDVTCGDCNGSGRAKVKDAAKPKTATSRYRDECTLGGRCLGGCLSTEPCYHALRAARAPADSVTAPAGGLGWKLVPMEITDAMRNAAAQAGMEALDLRDAGASNVGLVPKMYEAMLAAAPTTPAQAADSVLDAAFEAVRKKLCALPRYSFVLDNDGLVRRVLDRTGNWIEFDDAHELFDPVAVDAARKQGANHD